MENLVKCITHSLWDELGEHINLFFEQEKFRRCFKYRKKISKNKKLNANNQQLITPRGI